MRVLAQVPDEHRVIARVLTQAEGATMRQLTQARWTDWDPETRTLRLDTDLGDLGEVQLTPEVAALLGEHREATAGVPNRAGRIWPGKRGAALSFERLTAALRAALRAGGVRVEATPHHLRHTYAALSARAGVDVSVLSYRMGHHSPAFTLAVYRGLFQDERAERADVLDVIQGAQDGRRAPRS